MMTGLQNLIIFFFLKFTTLVYCDGENQLFCWKFQALPTETINGSGNIISWNYVSPNLITELENSKTNGKGIACGLPQNLLQLHNSCWKFLRDQTSDEERIDTILELFDQFSPLFAKSEYTNHFIRNWSVPICFTGESSKCENRDEAHLNINFSLPLTYERNELFENIYFSDKFQLRNNSLKICFLFDEFLEIISCLEKPFSKKVESNKNNELILRKRHSAKILYRNESCVPSPTIDPEIFEWPIEKIYVYTVLYGICLIFLFLFLIECLIISELQKYPKCLIMLLSLSLFFAKIFALLLIYINKSSYYPDCFILIFFYRIFYLGTYFWISVIGFDMWLTFRNVNSHNQEFLSHSQKKSRLISYFLFAWGIPSVIAISEILVLNYAHPSSNYHFVRWKNSCASWTRLTQNVFYSLPTAVILLTNVVFFCLTLKKIQNSNQQIVQSGNGTKLPHVIIKLLILFGFPWVMSVISDIVNYYLDMSVLHYIAIFITSSQGFFILFLFGCTKSMREKFKQNVEQCLLGNTTGFRQNSISMTTLTERSI